MQRAGKQPTKADIDLGTVTNYVRNNDLSKAIDYCMAQGISEEILAKIITKVEKERNKKEYYAIIVTYVDGSQAVRKGNRDTQIGDKYVDTQLLYKTYKTALNSKAAFDKNKHSLEKSFEIKRVLIDKEKGLIWEELGVKVS